MRLGHVDVRIEGSRIALTGRIDDATAFAELLPHVPPGDIVIDTRGVTYLSSVGMREWVRLIRALRERGSKIALERVPELVMTQLNLVRELASAVTVRSFQAPYECTGCALETRPMIDAVVHAALLRRLEPPRLPCPDCGEAMELGDFPERYLSIFKF